MVYLKMDGWTQVFLPIGLNYFMVYKGLFIATVLDGHLPHISLDVFQLALKESFIILKFPPQITDVLQPLDVSCSGPIKKKWGKMLNDSISTK